MARAAGRDGAPATARVEHAGLWRQVYTLVWKNFMLYAHYWLVNLVRCLVLPILFYLFLCEARNLLGNQDVYGVGEYSAVESLGQKLGSKSLVLVDHADTTGSRELVRRLAAAGGGSSSSAVHVVSPSFDVGSLCQQNFDGASSCFGAVDVYNVSLANERPWLEYKLRTPSSNTLNVPHGKSGTQSAAYPLQYAVDKTFMQMLGLDESSLKTPQVLTFTRLTQKEREENSRRGFLSGVVDILALGYFVGMLVVVYHLVGSIVSERENLTTALLTSMGCGYASRILSWHLSASLLYLPSWIIMGVLTKVLLFTDSNGSIPILLQIFAGFMLVSWSIFVAVWFRRAMLSSIAATIFAIVVAIIAQIVKTDSVAAVVVLGLLFPPTTLVFGYILMAKAESDGFALPWASTTPSTSMGFIVVFVIIIVDILVFPFLAVLMEHRLHGVGPLLKRNAQESNLPATDPGAAVQIEDLRKDFSRRSLFRRRLNVVHAVRGISLKFRRNEINCLLGQNGGGKSTTMEMISGFTAPTSGQIYVEGFPRDYAPSGLVSLCPQKNVMWNVLTVRQHVWIWRNVKSVYKAHDQADAKSSFQDVNDLIERCDLTKKANAKAGSLSGGQKRKLQLAIAFAGGSPICMIDEVSSGLDPLSRRVIWEIILQYRAHGKTIIMTTHYLDEADNLADYITILKQGSVVSQGPTVEFKMQHGNGYKLRLSRHATSDDYDEMSDIADALRESVSHEPDVSAVQFYCPVSGELEVSCGVTHQVVTKLVQAAEELQTESKIEDYQISGPKVEDVFLELLEDQESTDKVGDADNIEPRSSTLPQSISEKLIQQKLHNGRPVGTLEQVGHILRKRWVLLRRRYYAVVFAILVGILACTISMVLLPSSYEGKCVQIPALQGVTMQYPLEKGDSPLTLLTPGIVKLLNQSYDLEIASLQSNETDEPFRTNSTVVYTPVRNAKAVRESILDYQEDLSSQYAGLAYDPYASDSTPYMAVSPDSADSVRYLNFITNTMLKSGLGRLESDENVIRMEYSNFSSRSWDSGADTLRFLFIFIVGIGVYPAFALLYPCSERQRLVKALQYSNGVHPFSLWLAHLVWELPIITIITTVVVIVYAAVPSNAYYGLGYFWLVLELYGIAATLLSFIVSLMVKNSLAAFGLFAGYQVIYAICYIAGMLLNLTFGSSDSATSNDRIMYFTMALVAPICSPVRSFYVWLNIFGTSCLGPESGIASYFGQILLYGGPILYLIVQAVLLFAFLVWWDTGRPLPALMRFQISRKRTRNDDDDIVDTERSAESVKDPEVLSERQRVQNVDCPDDLKVMGLSKHFGHYQALDNVYFGVKRGECFALLGPNGAGKTTTFNVLRGELKASGGTAYVNGNEISQNKSVARSQLGVCPQFDAMDDLTVYEHLCFYAAVKGVAKADIENDVSLVMEQVGLSAFADRAGPSLSGGNKRKLSLAIALLGNPPILLVDEASSGMDAAAKRFIWKTLASVIPQRAVVLTTHSMEEADALASRIGILAVRFLAMGSVRDLRRRYYNGYQVQMELSSSHQQSREAVLKKLDEYMAQHFPGSSRDTNRVFGVLHFTVPAGSESVATLFTKLEDLRGSVGLQHYAVSQAMLEDLFLRIVRRA